MTTVSEWIPAKDSMNWPKPGQLILIWVRCNDCEPDIGAFVQLIRYPDGWHTHDGPDYWRPANPPG